MVSHPFKNNSNELVSSTDEEAKKFGIFIINIRRSEGRILRVIVVIKNFWKDSNALRNLESPK